MKYIINFFLIFFLASGLHAEKVLLDEIRVVIYHPKKNVAITTSDIRPALDGTPRTLRDIVIEMLMVLDKLSLQGEEDADIDRYIEQIQQQNGLSQSALEELFRQLGYTFEEGKDQLRLKQMIETIIDFRVRQDKRMMVTAQDMEEYYAQHPVYIPAVFTLQQAYISYEDYAPEKAEHMIQENKVPSHITWEDPFELEESDLAEDKQFIKTASLNSIVEQEKDDEGILITRLINRIDPQLLSYTDRKQDIEISLRKERYFTVLKEYQQKLLADAKLFFAYESDRKSVLG